ncbi:MAG: ABC transporter permease [Candidatus Cloacimonetes bacterium]|nr:ABC transporter permease [Candidatus Cloacimonadota bacterium]
MKKIKAIIQREYLTKVKKKSFIIMTILTPILLLLLMSAPFLMMRVQTGSVNIAILDQTGLLEGNVRGTSRYEITFVYGDIEALKASFAEHYDALLYIPNFDLRYPGGVSLFAEKQIGVTTVSSLERQIENIIENARFENAGIDRELIDRLRTQIRIESIIIADGVERIGNNAVAHILGLLMGFAMYFIVFAYGTMVMASIMNEKKNRIIEILVSSVRPFEIMIGKILGMAGVAMTQLLIWAILGVIFFAFISVGVIPFLDISHSEIENTMEMQTSMAGQNALAYQIVDFINDPGALHFPTIFMIFAFYFMFAYLFYATLYATLGAITDDEGQSQQFTMIVTLPVILSMIILVNVVDNPHSALAFWASIIPFSSPIVMLGRIPFHVPTWQLILSGSILVISFIVSTWLSGKIYRTAILLYGKKLTWKDLWKFVRI